MPAILCFSTVDWDYLWHRPQELMSQFARDGYEVLYVDTLGLRSPKLSDLPRIASRVRNRLRARAGGLRRTDNEVHVCSPLVLPFLNSRLARRLNLYHLIPALQKALAQIGAEELIVWVYLPTWTVLQCVKNIPHRMLVYECIDALSSNPAGVSLGYEAAEAEILQRADLVLASSESLYEEKKKHNPQTHWVPSGVAAHFFGPVEPVPQVESLKRPRIGFFGALDHRLDLELMKTLAQAHPDWSFVLIGAARCDLAALLDKENVHFLGAKPHAELPGYLSALDVLYLPYVIDQFTLHVFPAKIYECLASGKPVVATALPSLGALSGVVRLAAGADEFERALEAAVAEEDEGLQQQRVEVAQANAWESRFREIRAYVEGKEE
jgi:glycosyltransferase involved in cell wall biosynthesis